LFKKLIDPREEYNVVLESFLRDAGQAKVE
jgi:hypothetical protein